MDCERFAHACDDFTFCNLYSANINRARKVKSIAFFQTLTQTREAERFAGLTSVPFSFFSFSFKIDQFVVF